MSEPSLKDEIRRQARDVADRVVNAPADRKFREFYDGLRASDIPFLAGLVPDPRTLFELELESLYLLGQASIPLAVGFTMHQYMFSALATAPIVEPSFVARRKVLVDEMLARRRLIAVSSFGDNASTPEVAFAIHERGDRLYMNGRKAFQSIAGEADLMAVSGEILGRGLGFFVIETRGRPALEIGAAVFPGPMALTDTRSAKFTDYLVEERDIVSLDEQLTFALCRYATCWFEALIGACYLGGAATALEELRHFARTVRMADERPLAEVDGVIAEAGRLGIQLQSALAVAANFGAVIASGAGDGFIRAVTDASIIKYVSTRNAEAIVHGVRKLIGTRSMSPRSAIGELTGQIVFGPLHPLLESEIERSIGARVLGEDPYGSTVIP